MKILIWPLLFLCALMLCLIFFEEKLIFFPGKSPLIKCQIQGVKAVSTENLNYLIQEKSNASAILIHFHGNAGTACDRSFLFEKLKLTPYTIVLAEYPGYAGNTSKPNEKNLLKNAVVLWEHFQKQNKPIILFGESLGTAVATYLASRYPALALILQSPFPSLASVGQRAYPFLPVKYFMRNDFKAFSWASQVQCPVLALHGEEDQIIPLDLGKEMAQNFSNITFKSIPHFGHNDLVFDEATFWPKVLNFLKSHAPE